MTVPGPGVGSGTLSILITAGPPNSWTRIAFMGVTPARLKPRAPAEIATARASPEERRRLRGARGFSRAGECYHWIFDASAEAPQDRGRESRTRPGGRRRA